MFKRFYGCLLLIAASCQSANQLPASGIKLKLNADSSVIIAGGIDYSVLQDLKKNSLSAQQWQSLFAVYRMPQDTDMKDYQKEQPGTYAIKDSIIIFKPDTPFKKHQQYFVRFFSGGSIKNKTTFALGKANLNTPKYQQDTFNF
jgi:hypothetical protein